MAHCATTSATSTSRTSSIEKVPSVQFITGSGCVGVDLGHPTGKFTVAQSLNSRAGLRKQQIWVLSYFLKTNKAKQNKPEPNAGGGGGEGAWGWVVEKLIPIVFSPWKTIQICHNTLWREPVISGISSQIWAHPCQRTSGEGEWASSWIEENIWGSRLPSSTPAFRLLPQYQITFSENILG